MTSIALTIAGSDPSGGAGIQADLKTFHQRGVYGTSVITLITAQNTTEVRSVQCLSPQMVADQLEAVLEDVPPSAAKTGALGDVEIVRLIADRARAFTFPLVVDPVMISKHGKPLISKDAQKELARLLLPRAFLVTPNLEEAGVLAGMKVGNTAAMREAAVRIADLGPEAVLVKGGHLEGEAVDILFWRGEFRVYGAPRLETVHTHGTGCTYSACIAAELAKGLGIIEAVDIAKRFVTRAIATRPGIGRGRGPVNHHATIDESR